MLDVNWNPSQRDLRQFALIWLPIFAGAVGALILQRTGSWSAPLAIWGVALAVALLGLFRPARVRPLFVGWMGAAYPIGWTISHLVLAFAYYVVLTPIGLLLRLAGRDPLGRRRHGSAGSYWMPHRPPSDPASYFRQF
jgi:hypothetical protein